MRWETPVRFRTGMEQMMALQAHAAAQGVTKSQLLRDALDRHLAWLELPAWKRNARLKAEEQERVDDLKRAAG